MKKVYLLTGVLLSGLTLNAQRIENTVTAPASRNTYTVAKKQQQTVQAKAEGDVHFSEDFTSGTGWTYSAGTNQNSPGSTGQWSIVNAVPSSLVTQSQAGYGFPTAMNSTSGGNFAFINSDEAGGGATQDAYFTYDGTITTLAALTPGTALYVEFDNIYRHYQEQFWIEVSADNGANWIPFQVNAEVDVNVNSQDPEHDVINITSANLAGAAQVKFRLHYIGAWDWFWGVDDIKITEAWANDGLMLKSFMMTDPATTQGADYYQIPANQVSFPGFQFQSIAQNNGYATQAAFNTRATSTGYDELSDPSVVYAGNLASSQIDTFNITTPFNPGTAGTYDVMVSVDLGANTDSYDANDTTSFRNIEFGTTDYARDNGVYSGGITSFADQPTNAILGWYNYFNIFDNYSVGSIKTYLPSQASGFTTDYVYASVEAFDGTSFTEVMATEGKDVTPADAGAWLMLNSEVGLFDLTPGLYRVIFHRTEAGDNTLRIGMAQACPEGTVGGVKSDGSGEAIGLATPNALMIRLSSDYSGGINEAAKAIQLNVYPNPANSVANVTFNLNATSNVEMNVTDLTGKVVYTNNMNDVATGSHNVAINTESLNNGIYMVNITVNGVKTTQKFVVKK